VNNFQNFNQAVFSSPKTLVACWWSI